ncbi:MAG: hypothetical protein D6741_11425 [Planctomycetota bacterium]|nr:MAG: hypothetical protein D6741_11425 [Planctomycetota bacterium]
MARRRRPVRPRAPPGKRAIDFRVTEHPPYRGKTMRKVMLLVAAAVTTLTAGNVWAGCPTCGGNVWYGQLGAAPGCFSGYGSMLVPGCCEHTPSCADHIWDGYCAQKRTDCWRPHCGKCRSCATCLPASPRCVPAPRVSRGGCAACDAVPRELPTLPEMQDEASPSPTPVEDESETGPKVETHIRFPSLELSAEARVRRLPRPDQPRAF